MKHSIRLKLTFMLVVLTSATILLSWILNKTLVDDYYMASERKSLEKTYYNLNKVYNKTADNYQLVTEQIASSANVKVLVVGFEDNNINIISSSMNESGKMQESMVGFLMMIQDPKSSEGGPWNNEVNQDYITDLNSKHYIIQQHSDRQLKSEYLDLFGILDNGYLVVVRTPIESILESAGIASRLLAYIGIVVTFFGSLAMFFVSKEFTKPIREMAYVANKMKNLDFDAKVTNLSQDELGELGESINGMSMKLESTISELKTANNELRKDIDQKVQIDEMRKEFLSHVSHELKTPIALIQGYAEGLKDNINDDDESKDFYCEVIADEAHKMNQMVKKLLTLNQIEFGSNQVQMERFDIVMLIRNILGASDILFQKAGACIKFEEEQSIYVWADEFMIEEVLTNYISNALNHLSENGTIRVSIEQGENSVRIFVFNTGEPIPLEDLDKLWIKFYKVDKARTREYGGSGIGLSIVAATMEAHGKSYGVRNLEDGVEFYIDLDTRLQ